MILFRPALLTTFAAACGRIGFDAQPPDAPLGPWGAPSPVLIASGDDNPTLTGDMLEMYFSRGNDIYVTRRASLADGWSPPVVDPQLSTQAVESIPEISTDGLTLYFVSNRGGSQEDVWMSGRTSRAAPWSAPVPVPELDSPQNEGAPVVTDDGLFLVMPSIRSGNNELYTSSRTTTSMMWSTPILLAEVNSTSYDSDPFVTSDRLTLYFRSDRDGTADLFVATRATAANPFDAPVPITELNTPFAETDPWVSPDGRHIFFSSTRGGAAGLWEATR